jgi:crossover junction endodeoxyribonuclease RuvC
VILGIDPGLRGALALLDLDKGTLEVEDVPTIEAGTGSKRVLDEYKLAWWVDNKAKSISEALIERVSAMPGQGVVSMFSFGTTYGLLRGIVAANFIPTRLVTPNAWKSSLSVPAAKDGARARASQLFPRYAPLWARAKDDGRAEAAMIAYYGATHERR